MTDLFIHSGVVVDGTGAPSYPADIRIRDGVIAEIGPNLQPGEEPAIDAAGATVAPGIIETHTHVDGAMWWSPDLDPLPADGTTTAVFGNCGVSVAPINPETRDEVVDLFCFLEDLPKAAFDQQVPWNWSTWAEYAAAAKAQPVAINTAGYLGHISLRAAIMGTDAWERAATSAEISAMADELSTGLAAGAVGLSSNGFDKDQQLRLVPSRLADDAEFEALFEVLADHDGATFQAITRFNEPDNFADDVRRFARMAKAREVRGQWTAIPSTIEQAEHRALALDLHRELRADGVDFWATMGMKPLDLFFGFERSLVFTKVKAWHDLVNGPQENKRKLLADPAWRAQARTDWDNRERTLRARVDRPHTLLLSLSENGVGPTHLNLVEFAEAEGLHLSDALAEWLCRNGIGSALAAEPDAFDEAALAEIARDPHVLTNINDSGAHLQLFCGAGQAAHLLTHYVREMDLLSLEEAVHLLTGRTADFFGFTDRGKIEVGKAGDVCIFDLAKVQLGREIKASDVPGGTWRYTRESGGFDATIVAGQVTFAGQSTGARPGTLIRR